MDNLKRGTCKDYTAWDLNCPRFVKPDNNLRKKFNRKYRRKTKQAIDKSLSVWYNDTIKDERVDKDEAQ